MSSGVFGSIRPAKIDIDKDVEIFYTYRPSRGETSSAFGEGFKKLDPSSCLVETQTGNDDGSNTVLDGLFTLKLPLNIFGNKGFYTIYIRPKEIKQVIVANSVLGAYPDVRGIVLQANNELPENLVGYRIELSNGKTRLIKSCNPCEPILVGTVNGNKEVRYNLNVSTSNLFFCTVTPSSAPSFNISATPEIGRAGEEIKIINTKFSPKVIEIEMVDHDMDTLSYMLEGTQINDRDNAIITTYNDKNQIYHQADYYVLKDELGTPVYNVRKRRSNVSSNNEYENILNDNG